MSAFTLDTSGKVDAAPGQTFAFTLWSGLSPFEKGHVEALLRAYSEQLTGALGEPLFVGFSDLAPETLAAIRKDCAARNPEGRYGSALGRQFFWNRQNGLDAAFPPLTVTLGDDGKVRLSAVADTTDRSAMPRDEP